MRRWLAGMQIGSMALLIIDDWEGVLRSLKNSDPAIAKMVDSDQWQAIKTRALNSDPRVAQLWSAIQELLRRKKP